MSFCKKCGAEIKFIVTKNKKNMPVDIAEVVPSKTIGQSIIVSESGIVCQAKNADSKEIWHVSHFSSCPFAEDFRKR